MTGRILHGDCREQLATLPDNSIDAIVTDPPYELGFMGKQWDASGIAYDPTVWTECLRVLKPGGHLLAFGGTRTYHRMTAAIEDAGFEIRDSIHWLYGSGFPKSLDVSKAIDKAAGAEREVVGPHPYAHLNKHRSHGSTYGTPNQTVDVTAPATDAAHQWNGWGTALKPAHEPIVLARKPLTGTVAANVLEYGTGALNIDATRVRHDAEAPAGRTRHGGGVVGNGTSWELPDNRTPMPAGRWPANLVLTHSPECEQTGTRPDTFGGGAKATSGFVDGYEHDGFVGQTVDVPTWSCVPECPVAILNGQPNGDGASRFFTTTTWGPEIDAQFFYVAKPSRRERNAGLDGMPEKHASKMDGGAFVAPNGCDSTKITAANFHPTVKPVALMRHLVRLITPSGGIVLDPFLGSGTTAVAATIEGFDWIGCELTADYLPIIEARVAWAEQQTPDPIQPELF
jgi:DNA modification methylase